jgi:hypothetical protein
MRIGSYKYEVCGRVNVINLFRDEDKCAKKFVAIHADCKGNFARERSRVARAKFCADRAIAHIRIGSHRARSQNFASRRKSRAFVKLAPEFFRAIEKYFLIAAESSRKCDDLSKKIR